MSKKFLLVVSGILIISGVVLTTYVYYCTRSGEKFMQSGEYEKAINSFRKVLSLGHTFGYTNDSHFYPSLYFLIGICYTELEEYDKAKENLRKAIELSLYRQNKTNKYILEKAKMLLEDINS
jgi:tetratricopeptide (TPR) repeat protein